MPHQPPHAYTSHVEWHRGDASFTDDRYSREHVWRFDGGVVVPASSSPQAVRLPWSNPDHVDPEEAFVAALSSCHMLTFLWLAARAGFRVDRYVDAADGRMEDIAPGRQAITRVTLRPAIDFSGGQVPDDAVLASLHHDAHDQCFLANSVRTHIDVQGRWRHVPQDPPV